MNGIEKIKQAAEFSTRTNITPEEAREILALIGKAPRKHAYAAIRKTEDSDREFIDVGSMEVLREQVQERIDAVKARIPSYDAANPVVRISLVVVEEA